jgi:hypothetical protein
VSNAALKPAAATRFLAEHWPVLAHVKKRRLESTLFPMEHSPWFGTTVLRETPLSYE